jgi:hypothetical protein
MWRPLELSALLFLLAVLCQLNQLLPPDFGLGSRYEMASIARSIVNHGVFGDPFEPIKTGPTAAEPPLFPLFLALIVKVFRSPVAISCVVTFCNLAVNSLIAALMPFLSEALCGDMASGVAGALFWIAGCRLLPAWDASYVLLGAVVFVLYTTRRFGAPDFLSAAITGAMAGMLLLLNPACLLSIVPWFAFLWTSRPSPKRARIRFLAILLAVAALCNLPWLIRNYNIWGRLVVRSNFGMTLYASNNDCASVSTGTNISSGCYGQTHPAFSAAEVERIRTLGEVEYDRRRTAEAIAWIRSHPFRFGHLLMARMVQFWLPAEWGTRFNLCATWATTILSLPGLLLLARTRGRLALFFLGVWVLYPAMYYIVMADLRYRYPILWTSLLPAGYAVAASCRTVIAVFRGRPSGAAAGAPC